MKADESLNPSPEDIVNALRESLPPADRLREQLMADDHDVFIQSELLTDGLAAWNDALMLYTVADRECWSEEEQQAVEDEFGRVSALMNDLVVAQDNLPPIETDLMVAFDDDEILLQQRPEEEQEEGPSCCFTRLRFRNLTQWRVQIRVTGDDGQQESHVFRPGERRSVRRIDGRGRTVPGGLGRCLRIEARARYRNGWGEYHATRLCCDDDPLPPIKSELPLTRPVNERHSTRFPGIQLLARDALSPCPETQAGGGTASTGTASSGITGIPGIEVARRRYHYGAHTVLRFVPSACRRFCFVQGKKRVTRAKFPGAQGFRVMPGMSTPGITSPGDRWILDIPGKGNTPCYPHTRPLAGGGQEMRDYPGVENPFGSFDFEGQAVRLPPGTELEATWTMRTWVICLDPRRVHLLGQFDWGFVLHLTIGRGFRDTTGRVVMTPPRWSETTDAAEYNSVARQAPKPAGFLLR